MKETIDIKLRKNSVTIVNSYLIISCKRMRQVLDICDWNLEKTTDFRVSKFKNIVEWKAHNLLYYLHIMQKHSMSVDFERKEKWYRRLGYYILFPIAYWIGR